ncbi:MAG: hypothetical protein ACRD4Y_15155, partial [Candidatus Acidiferrales bacterium]
MIAPEAKAHVDRIGKADLVVALPYCQSREQLDKAAASLRPVLSTMLPDGKAVVLHPNTATAAPESTDEPKGADSSFDFFPYPMAPVVTYPETSLSQALRSLFQVGMALSARVCVMVGSETCAEDVGRLAEPVLNNGYDLAAPLYARRKFDSLINSGIVYPLTRAMYGARLHYPMAAELAMSARLAENYLQPPANGRPESGWITMKAVRAGLQVCQVHRGAPPAPSAPEPEDLSGTLAQVLSTLFLGLESNAAFWQRVRGSHSLRTFGRPSPRETETSSVDVHDMIETFQRGCRDLLDIWVMALTPATLLDLKKLARQSQEQFRMADSLWVHVLYDFILGHRQRVINREHLLRAMTPIYLAWVASYALEVQSMAPAAVED